MSDFDEGRAIAARDMPASLRRLDDLTDPVSRAVLDLHRRQPSVIGGWECAHCLEASDMGDHLGWPCDTVEAVAAVHGIPLDDFWLLTRPADGSLDQPPTEHDHDCSLHYCWRPGCCNPRRPDCAPETT